ncbi:kinase-like domain-containing protein [Cladochytrium replicatum]|nr:kinase-like domain-containing protein [Cladochytrium replicatum]
MPQTSPSGPFDDALSTDHLRFDFSPDAINLVLTYNGTFAPIHLNHLRAIASIRAFFNAKPYYSVAGAYITPVPDKRAISKLSACVDPDLPLHSRSISGSPHSIFAPGHVRLSILDAVISNAAPPADIYAGKNEAVPERDKYSLWLAVDDWQVRKDSYAAATAARIRMHVEEAFLRQYRVHVAESAGENSSADLSPPSQILILAIGGADTLARIRNPRNFVLMYPLHDPAPNIDPHPGIFAIVPVLQTPGLSSTAVRSRMLRGLSVEEMVDTNAVPLLQKVAKEWGEKALGERKRENQRAGMGNENVADGSDVDDGVKGPPARVPVKKPERNPAAPERWQTQRVSSAPLYNALMAHLHSQHRPPLRSLLFWILSSSPINNSVLPLNPPPALGDIHVCSALPPSLDFHADLTGTPGLATRLGSGRVAPAYLLHHVPTSTDVAIKMYDLHTPQLKRTLASFARESLALSSFSHPNVVRLVGCGITTTHAIEALELADRGNLTALLGSRTHISLATRVDLLRQVAKGMAHVAGEDIDHAEPTVCPKHARSAWVHRDLSPDNILIFSTPSGSLRAAVSDFSQAKPVGDTSKVLRGACKRYAPESLRELEHYTVASDVFMFATVAYETLHGGDSFWEGLSTQEAVERTLAGIRPVWDVDRLVEMFVVDRENERAVRRVVEGIRVVVESCWNGEPGKRIRFTQAVSELEKLGSIVVD